jgi:hypothetical protein
VPLGQQTRLGSPIATRPSTREEVIPDDLFAKTRLEPAGKPLTVFRAELTGSVKADWQDLFAGFTTLKAITFSSSIELLLRLSQQLDDNAGERVIVNRRAGEITIGFGGDTIQAAQFARMVPDFVLKGRFADLVKLDLKALEEEMGFDVLTARPWWHRLIRMK